MVGLAAWNALGADSAPEAQKTNSVPGFASVFTMPTSVKEGRDPFYPESTRVFDALMAANQAKQASPTVEITSLKFVGVSGTPGHLLAIINNHTFAAGDEGDVLTPSGRIHLRCAEVKPGYAVVIVNGQFHQLKIEQP